MAHFVLGERNLRALIEDNVLDRRRWDQQRPRRPGIAQVFGSIDGNDAVARSRFRYVDGIDAGMRDVAAQECRVEHSRKLDIVDKQRAAAQEPRILVAGDRSAETSRRHFDDPLARSAASSTASTMC